MTVAEPRSRNVTSTEVLVAGMVLCALGGTWMRDGVAGNGRLATAGTVFCGVFLQAVPFLVLGVLISGLVATFVSPERLTRWLPRRSVGAVLTAGVAGAALPGCECASVPVARRLFGDGSAGAAALTFMLSAHRRSTRWSWWPPRSPSRPTGDGVRPMCGIAGNRGGGGSAVVSLGRLSWITRTLPQSQHNDASRWTVFTEAARHDFLQAASYLAIGAAAAAILRVAVPPWVFEHVAGHVLVGVVTMALLAFVLALCSEADAFVAASLTMVPLLPRLVFLVVGPAVDVKLVAMQAGLFDARSRCDSPRSPW